MQDLETLYEKVFNKLGDNEEVEFSPDDFSLPPQAAVTPGLAIHRHRRAYLGYVHEQAYLLAHKATFRRLALLMIAGIFHDSKKSTPTRIELANPASDLGALFIDNGDLSFTRVEDFTGRVVLDKFLWNYGDIERHPWRGHLPADVDDLPRFNFTDQDDGETSLNIGPDKGLVIQGRRTGQARIIDLLLRISDKRNSGNEYILEGEDGFRGVAPASIEVGFVLPGSIYWDAWADGL